MAVYKQILHDNIKTLVKYGYEPEIDIVNDEGLKALLIAYPDYLEFYDYEGNHLKLYSVEELDDFIEYDEIVSITDESGLDLSEDIFLKHAEVIDGKLFLF